MGRRKLSKKEKLELVGVSLPPQIVERLADVREQWKLTTNSAAAREIFLLGLSMYESMAEIGVVLPFLNLTNAYRRRYSPAPHTAPTEPATSPTDPQPDPTPLRPIEEAPGPAGYEMLFGAPAHTVLKPGLEATSNSETQDNDARLPKSKRAGAQSGSTGGFT